MTLASLEDFASRRLTTSGSSDSCIRLALQLSEAVSPLRERLNLSQVHAQPTAFHSIELSLIISLKVSLTGA